MKKIINFVVSFIFCLTPMFACSQSSWKLWISELRKEAISQKIDPVLFDRIFNHLTLSQKHLHFDQTQPEKRISYEEYRTTRGDPYRIQLGKKEFQKHKLALNEIGQAFGVDPCVITALWGLESSYGRFIGGFNVIQSLATLAYDGRRSNFFRKQLLLALHMLNDGQISYQNFKGEWAGATGQPQFLPSSFYQYAVDYNGDGKRDIWKNYEDIFASIANYLKQNGWKYHQPVLIPVRLPSLFDRNLIGLTITKPYQKWIELRVRPNANQYIDPHLDASIIHPDGGPSLMVFNNFKTLMKWNRSIYYAGTVDYVAKKICQFN